MAVADLSGAERAMALAYPKVLLMDRYSEAYTPYGVAGMASAALWAKRRRATGRRLRPEQVRVCRPTAPYPPPKPQPAPVWARPGWLSEPYYRAYARGGYVGDDW